MLLSIENLDEAANIEEEEDSFTTKQLFSFAWQIAKGMVIILTAWATVMINPNPAFYASF